MAQNTQGNTFLLVVILIALLAVAGLMISQQAPPPTQVQGLQNSADLEKASMELDSVNVDAMDSGLNEISRDAAAI